MAAQENMTCLLIKPDGIINLPGTASPQLAGKFVVSEHEITKSEFENGNLWNIAPVTTRLGFPLKVSASPISDGGSRHNNCVAGLFCCYDTTSPIFGMTTKNLADCKGTFKVARCDAQTLHEQQFSVVYTYLTELFGVAMTGAFLTMPVFVQQTLKGDIMKGLRPRVFAAHYERHRKKKIESGDEQWNVLKCPVQFEYSLNACAVCEAASGNDGRSLSMCRECKKARYCSRECQRVDWKQHKHLCALVADQ